MIATSPSQTLSPAFAPAAPVEQDAAVSKAPGVVFGLFLFLNFVLYVRPSEVVPALLGLEIYLFVIGFCLLATLPQLVPQLWPDQLIKNPLTVCIMGLTVAVFLSNMANGRPDDAFTHGGDFFKVLLYYMLFKAVVTDKARLRTLLICLTLFISMSTLLSVLELHKFITLPTAASIKDGNYLRLRGTGIFNDPNDLCVLLCLGLMFGAYLLMDRRTGLLRFVWLAPMGLLFYALIQTQSRGGLLALMAGLMAMLRARLGWMRALLLGLVVLPMLLVLVNERQSSISTSAMTGQSRVGLWSDGLVLFRNAPVFGIGSGQYDKQAGQVAHNSYIQAFAETGALGGMLFVGAFFVALRGLERLCPDRHLILDPELKEMHPYVLGGLTSYMMGMCTLTLTYLLPTFGTLALAAVLVRLAPVQNPPEPVRFDLRFVGRLLLCAVGFLLVMTLFVRVARPF